MENILVLQGSAKGSANGKKALSVSNLKPSKKSSIYGLIGKNRAGKTLWSKSWPSWCMPATDRVSLVPAIRLDTSPQAGSARYIETARAHNMTPTKILSYYCKLRQIPNADKAIQETLNYVDLTNTGMKKFRDFSLGMKQRLSIAIPSYYQTRSGDFRWAINGLRILSASRNFASLSKKLNEELGMTFIISVISYQGSI